MITGDNLIGKGAVLEQESTLHTVDPALETELEPTFGGGGTKVLTEVLATGLRVFEEMSSCPSLDNVAH
jgi:hypothetical protein